MEPSVDWPAPRDRSITTSRWPWKWAIFAPTIRSVPSTTQKIPTHGVTCMGRLATAVCSSARRVARSSTTSLIAAWRCPRWPATAPSSSGRQCRRRPDALGHPRSGHASVHAKLVVVDRRWVYLGSANFTRSAFHRNLEAGIRVRDRRLGEVLVTYFDRLIQDGYLSRLSSPCR